MSNVRYHKTKLVNNVKSSKDYTPPDRLIDLAIDLTLGELATQFGHIKLVTVSVASIMIGDADEPIVIGPVLHKVS